MALNLEGKKAIVAEVNETAAQALSLVIADARGVDVTDMNALRAKAASRKRASCAWSATLCKASIL